MLLRVKCAYKFQLDDLMERMRLSRAALMQNSTLEAVLVAACLIPSEIRYRVEQNEF